MIDRREFIRPSNLGPMSLCPGKVLMEAKAVDALPILARIKHPQAEEGTNGHTIIAQALTMIYQTPTGPRDPAEVLSQLEGMFAGVTAWTANAVRKCIAYVVSVVEREKSAGWKVAVLIEMHLSGQAIGITRGGTADIVIICRDAEGVKRLVLIDHKLGFLNQGEAAEHEQLAGYAVMGWHKWECEEVEVHLAQGRLGLFSAAVFDEAALESAAKRCLEITAGALGASPEILPSIKACRYCKALVLCRAAREEIMKANDEAAMFGISDEELVKMDEVAAIARRFAEEVSTLKKEMVKENAAA